MSTSQIPMIPIDAPPTGEPESPAGKIAAKTPWWAVSAGMHAMAVVVLSFFVVLMRPVQDVGAVVVSPARKLKEAPKWEQPDRPQTNPHPEIRKPAPKDPVFRKDVEKSDHTETKDEDEFRQAKGDSLEFVSDQPFKGYGVNTSIGTGGGAAGRYGTRFGGPRDLATQEGGGDGTQVPLTEALRWLARHQNPDGSWGVQGYTAQCNRVLPDGACRGGGPCSPNPGDKDYDTGVTGLSLLAFLGAGYSHLSKEVYDGICFGDVVRRGLQWMMLHQDPEGMIGPREGNYMYNHEICALALSEAYGLTGSNIFKNQAQRAIDFIVAAQNDGKGWRYSYRCGDNDSSVTAWAVMALKSAELSGLEFPQKSFEGARRWYDEVTEEGYYRVGYNARGTGKVFCPHNAGFDHHEALTAIGVMCRIFMDKNKADPRLRGGCELLLKDLPRWETNAIDFYYWYNATMALFQYDGPKGPLWSRWNKSIKDVLVKNQNTTSAGCRDGSWEPVSRWSCEGGRVYATAINALTLEIYFRYINVFTGSR